jgi:hypothetical protein
MENLLEIIFILSIIKYSCKATFFRKYWGILLFSVVAAVFAYLIHPLVIKNNIQVFTDIFSEKVKITDLALVITTEAISGIMVSVSVLQNSTGEKKRRGITFLKLSPGVIIAGAIFYMELKTFYFFPGVSFLLTALVTSVALLFVIGIISVAVKTFLPEEDMRYEFKFFINIVLLIAAIILNAGLAAYNRGNYEMEPALPRLLVFISLVVIVGALGFTIQRMASKGKLKKLHKWI